MAALRSGGWEWTEEVSPACPTSSSPSGCGSSTAMCGFASPSKVMLSPCCPMAGRTWEMVSAGNIPVLAPTQLPSVSCLWFYCLLLATTGFNKCWVKAESNMMLCYPGSSLWVSATFGSRRRHRHHATLLRARLGPQVIPRAVCLRGATPGNYSSIALLSKSHAVSSEYAVGQDEWMSKLHLELRNKKWHCIELSIALYFPGPVIPLLIM